MSAILRQALGILAFTAILLQGADSAGQSTSDQSDKAKTPLTKILDALKLPPGSVYVLNEKGEIVRTLSAEEYEKLASAAAKARSQQQEKLHPPSVGRISGRIEGDQAHLQIKFTIITDQPDQLVSLGCQNAIPRQARINVTELPFFVKPKTADEGYVVLIRNPGKHELSLDVSVPIVVQGNKGNEQGFELNLPWMVITKLDRLTLPNSVKKIRINKTEVATRTSAGQTAVADFDLGSTDKLQVSWQGATPMPKGTAPLVAADSEVHVHIDERRGITNDVTMDLQVLRGAVSEWRIKIPPHVQFDLKEPASQNQKRFVAIELPKPSTPWLVVRYKTPNSDPLRLVFQVKQVRKGATIPVGPFSVAGAYRQRGTVLVSAPERLRLNYVFRGEVSQREIPQEMRDRDVVAAFNFWNLPAPSETAKPDLALLELQIDNVEGAVETSVEHTLRILKGEYELDTKIHVVPNRIGVETLEIDIPRDYPFDEERGVMPLNLIEGFEIDRSRGMAVVRVKRQVSPFDITLPARALLEQGVQHLKLRLPRPVKTFDRGSQFTAILPPSFELVDANLDADALPPGTHQYTWRWHRIRDTMSVHWRPYRPELVVDSIVDLTLRRHQGDIRQQLVFQFPDVSPGYAYLEIPKETADVRISKGGVLVGDGLVRLDNPNQKTTLELTCSFPLPEGEVVAVPIVKARDATQSKTKVRVWCALGEHVAIGPGPWLEQPAEIVPEHDSLTSLVVATTQKEARLVLRRVRTSHDSLMPVVIDRALVQVAMKEGETQSYRVRFLISRLKAQQLDLELPALLAGLNLQVRLAGKLLPQQRVSDASGETVRLMINPENYRPPVILDIRYEIAPGGTKGNSALKSTFYPPVLRGDVFLGRVRWEVTMPPQWIPLYDSGGPGTALAWEWRGGLLTPKPAVRKADLERWLLGPELPLTGEAVANGTPGGFVAWRTSLEPLRVMKFPRQAWLLGTSLIFLIGGLILSFAPLPRSIFWTALFLLALGLAYMGIFWPDVLTTVVYGCEPGAAILALILATSWLVQTRYRRQVVNLPEFTRMRTLPESKKTAWPKEPPTEDAIPARKDPVRA